MPPLESAQHAEFAHILFIDIVGFSKNSMEAQLRLTGELTRLVRGTSEFQRAEADGELLCLPTGDGMALSFFRYPLAPVQCAVEIARALAGHGNLPLRMGIHYGPVHRGPDINGQTNVTGDGIIMAQRVMDCGDAGHILLSATGAEALRHFEGWRDTLQELGEFEVKHGVRLRLFNLCQGTVGNPALPQKLGGASPSSPPASVTAVTAETSQETASIPSGKLHQTVALIYKRHAPHSQHLLDLLETGLKAAGYGVFIDRHLAVGVEWAQELKRQVRAAYAVVPLLSAESIWSEMVEDEIQTAYEASQTQSGLPRLLPVRVAYDGPLPAPLEAILAPLQYTAWHGKQDDERLLAALLAALRQPIRASTPVPREPDGGAVPLDSQFYIARPTDAEFAAALQRQDSIVLVKGARQMGKTSLLTRGLQQARLANARCLRTDFQKLTSADLHSEETFFLALAEMIADQLDLDVLPDASWNTKRGGAHNFERYLRREVLKTETPLVWALDEVDKLFHCSFGSDVFALFRSWHNDRAYEPDGPWSRLTLVIAYATEAHLFITDVNQSPFNVGTRLALDDFTLPQTAELNARYQSPLRTDAETRQLWELTGGQPYLTRRAFDALVHQNMTLERLAAHADQDEGPFGDHLRRLLVMLSQDAETLATVRGFLRGQPLPNAAVFYRLRSGGLLAGPSESEARLRCALYGRYLARHL